MTPEKDTLIQIKRLSTDSEYFINVFKRTEKIVSVIFYILANLEDKKDNQVHIDVLKDRAFDVHEVSLQTLRLQPQDVVEGLLLRLVSELTLGSQLPSPLRPRRRLHPEELLHCIAAASDRAARQIVVGLHLLAREVVLLHLPSRVPSRIRVANNPLVG